MKHHFTTHGMSRTRIYSIWRNMINRCDNPNVPSYGRYGGRGISYDASWSNFINFYNDTKAGYRADLTLDRIDNNADYSKSNCRWSTQLVQQNNKRNTIRHSYHGKSLTLSEWARLLNKKPSTLRQRYYSYNWPIERVLGV